MTELVDETRLLENPLLEGLRVRRTPEPLALTIFGASGDLTQRKLMPALYALAYRRLLPDRFGVVGAARTEMTADEFREQMREAVEKHGRDEFREDVWHELAEGMRYVAMEFEDEVAWDALAASLIDLDKARGTAGNRVY